MLSIKHLYIICVLLIFNLYCNPPALAGMSVNSREAEPDFRKCNFPPVFLETILVKLFKRRISGIKEGENNYFDKVVAFLPCGNQVLYVLRIYRHAG